MMADLAIAVASYLAMGFGWIGICRVTGAMTLHPNPGEPMWLLQTKASVCWPYVFYRLLLSVFERRR
jgi:hypothetical protein